MKKVLYLGTCTPIKEYKENSALKISLESLITYSVYRYCNPADLKLFFVHTTESETKLLIDLKVELVNYIEEVPWQVASCLYPVVLFDDTVITGLCAVSRHICKLKKSPNTPQEHEDGLLSFRKGCLQAPNEVSIWTKFCEVDLIKTVKELMSKDNLKQIPKSLIRFENHLNKPVKIHNVYKIARDLKKESNTCKVNILNIQNVKNDVKDDTRTPKQRKWNSNKKKIPEINSSIKIEDLHLSHKYAEGPFFTLADLVLMPSYHIIIQIVDRQMFESLFPLTYKWFSNVTAIPEVAKLITILQTIQLESVVIENMELPEIEDVSLYKSDPKRHNPKKRLFTKPEDIERALNILENGMELDVSSLEYDNGIDWNLIPDGANPAAGHLPNERVTRKSQQLENLCQAVLKMAKEGDHIVDFCSGSGHLGILIAYLLPKCTVMLLENKEQSLLRARERVHKMGLKNVYFYQCNLDFFIGKFDIGIALHACGIASDLVLDKCLKANAKFVLCPCCYGSLHATDRLVYPRSSKFSNMTIDQYLCIGHTADQTHKEHPLTVRGERCMAIIDSDRARLAEEFGYTVTLSRLKPLSCTDKNNLLIGIPA